MKKDTMIPLNEVSDKWFERESFRKAYDLLEEEYTLVHAMIEARIKAGLARKKFPCV